MKKQEKSQAYGPTSKWRFKIVYRWSYNSWSSSSFCIPFIMMADCVHIPANILCWSVDLLHSWFNLDMLEDIVLYSKNSKFIQASMELENSSLGGQISTSKALSKYWVYIKLNSGLFWWGNLGPSSLYAVWFIS